MNELSLKIGDKVLITNGISKEDQIGTVIKITPTGRIKVDMWNRHKSIRIPSKEDYENLHKNKIIAHIYSKIRQLNTENLYDTS